MTKKKEAVSRDTSATSFVHAKRSQARTAAIDAGIDLDTVVIKTDPATGQWGWVDAEAFIAECEAQEGKRERRGKRAAAPAVVEPTVVEAPIEPRLVAHASADFVEAFGMESLVGAGLVVVDEGRPVTEPEMPAPEPEHTEPGPVTHDADAPTPVVFDQADEYVPEATTTEVVIGDVTSNVVPFRADPTEGLLICDEIGGGEQDVILQLGAPMLRMAGRVFAEALAKRLGEVVTIRGEASGEIIEVVLPRAKRDVAAEKATKAPRVVSSEYSADGKDYSQWRERPAIRSAAHQSVTKLLDRIDDGIGNVGALEAVLQSFKPSCTYYKMAYRYAMALLQEARAMEATANDDGTQMADAAD